MPNISGLGKRITSLRIGVSVVVEIPEHIACFLIHGPNEDRGEK